MFWKKEKYTFRSDSARQNFLKNIEIECSSDSAQFFDEMKYPIQVTRIDKFSKFDVIFFTAADGVKHKTHNLKNHYRQYFKKVVDKNSDGIKPEPMAGNTQTVEPMESLIDSICKVANLHANGTSTNNSGQLRKILTDVKSRRVKYLEGRITVLEKESITLTKRIDEHKTQLAALR